jgi:hypothetical protein
MAGLLPGLFPSLPSSFSVISDFVVVSAISNTHYFFLMGMYAVNDITVHTRSWHGKRNFNPYIGILCGG